MMSVPVSVEPELRAGFRSPARDGVGIYLVSERVHECRKIPIAFRAPQVGGFTWIPDAEALGLEAGRHGLAWVSSKHYPTTHDFLAEAMQRGVSRRIQKPLKDFVFDETRVYLAHSKTFLTPEHRQLPGIFAFFIPSRIDLVVGKQIPERAEELAKKIGDRARIVSVLSESERQGQLFP
jgi:hypothetical protein